MKEKNCQTAKSSDQQTNSVQEKKVNKSWEALMRLRGNIVILDPSILEFQ